MAMNKQRSTSNLFNILNYDAAGNIVLKDYSQTIRYNWNGTIHAFTGPLSISSITAATTDTDKFIVSDGGVLKYRTGAEVLSDIGAQAAGSYVPTARTLTINGISYDLSADRSWTITAGITGSGAAGQVAYWNGTSSQTGSNNLFWDAANARLGIGTATPASPYRLDVNGAIQTNDYLMSPAVYSNGAFQLGVLGGTVGFRLTTLLNTQLFGGATPADSGQRLQVIGDAFIKGSGATSATNALTIQNSAGTGIFSIRNDQVISINGLTKFGNVELWQINDGNYGTSAVATELKFETSFISGVTTGGFGFRFGLFNAQRTSASTTSVFNISGSFSPTSGTQTFADLAIGSLINQTGGANGITRGLYVNPTLTAAADWRSIEWSNNTGWGLYGAGTASNYLGGNLLVKTTTDTGYAAQITSATGDNQLSVWGATSPSIRLDNAASGATQRFVIGLATATNNFITGAVAGDICLTTQSSSPLLFGANATEVMRLSVSSNVLIGKTTDGGQRLQVNGTVNFANLPTSATGLAAGDIWNNGGVLNIV